MYILKSPVTCNNNISQEIKKGILIANKCCYGLNKLLIRPDLTYASETCVLSTTDKKLLLSLKETFQCPYMAQSKTTMNKELGAIMNCTLCLRIWIS
jgi:hypothetical protein